MKKIILPILLFMMFIPYVVNAETCDTDKISISSITVGDKSENVVELDEATASGKIINLNLSMAKVGDNIEYKFVVKNDSNEDYELDKTNLNINSDYINYSFETEDNSNIIEANSSKNVTLRIEYKNDVPGNIFESGIYNDNSTMTVQLSNGSTINVPDTFKNPNTGVQSYILIILILLLISGSLYILLKKKKYTKFMILVIGTAIIIPMSVYAICKCEIKIESNIVIKSGNRQCSHIPRDLREFVMCEIETDIYDITKKECDDIINNPNSAIEEINDAKNLIESYDYLISQFDWDSYIDRNINESNYMNYPEGLYVNGIRSMSFYKNESYNDVLSYVIHLSENNLDYSDFLPNWNKKTLEDLSGYSFTKPGKNDKIRYLFSRDAILKTELIAENAIDLRFDSPIDITKYYKSYEIEDLDINNDISTSLLFEQDVETGGRRYIKEEWDSNPENISQTLLNCKVPLINSLVDLYVNTMRSSTYIWNTTNDKNQLCLPNGLDSFEELFSMGKQKGYLKYSLQEIKGGKIDNKTKQLLEAFKIDPDLTQQSCAHNDFDWNNVKIVYKGKYYEGEKSIFEFMFDYYNITGIDYDSKLKALYDHLFDITLSH